MARCGRWTVGSYWDSEPNSSQASEHVVRQKVQEVRKEVYEASSFSATPLASYIACDQEDFRGH